MNVPNEILIRILAGELCESPDCPCPLKPMAGELLHYRAKYADDELLKQADEELPDLIGDSDITMIANPTGPPDAKIAVELGYILLFGKPMIVMTNGQPVPDKLQRIADHTVETFEEAQELLVRLGVEKAIHEHEKHHPREND